MLKAHLIDAAFNLIRMNKPANKDYKSVLNYFWETRPVKEKDEEWITRKEDLITLRPGREHAWLDSSVEHLLKWGNSRLIEVCIAFQHDVTKRNTDCTNNKKTIRTYSAPKKLEARRMV
jgi:hypothetical protein